MNEDDYIRVVEKHNNEFIISKLLQQEVIIRKKGFSEAGYLKAVEYNKDIFNLDSVISPNNYNKKDILIGYKLARKLNVSEGDFVNLVYEYDNNFIVKNVKVGGIFKTDIQDFDKFNILCDLSLLYENFQNKNFESIVLNKHNQNQNNNILINHDEDRYNYMIWNQKYSTFLSWLDQFDSPINILLFFIILICIVNILSTTYVDVNYRIKDVFLLQAIGFSINKIVTIYTFKYTFLSFIGGLLGYFFVLIFQYFQNTFHIIKIPENIYYMKYLPIEVHASNFFQIIVLLPFLSFILSFLIIKKIINKKLVN